MWKLSAPSAGSARASRNPIGGEERAGRSWGVFLTKKVRPPRKRRTRRSQENSASRRLGGGFNVALRADHGLKSGLQHAACYDNCLSGSGLRATGGRKPPQARKEATVAVRFVCRGLPGAWH